MNLAGYLPQRRFESKPVCDHVDRYWSPFMYLVAREIRTRYTGDPLGYAWSYITPLAWIGVIYATYSFTGRSPSIATDLFSFVIAGVMPYMVFRYTIATMLRVQTGTAQLRLVTRTPIQNMLAAVALIEFYNSLLIYAALFVLNWLIFDHAELANPLYALAGFTLAWGLGAAFGYLAVVLSLVTPAVPRLVPTVLRPVFFLSGIFFTANELPGPVIDVLQHNPLLDIIEIVRTGLFHNYTSRYLDFSTPILTIFVLFSAGWLLNRKTVDSQPPVDA